MSQLPLERQEIALNRLHEAEDALCGLVSLLSNMPEGPMDALEPSQLMALVPHRSSESANPRSCYSALPGATATHLEAALLPVGMSSVQSGSCSPYVTFSIRVTVGNLHQLREGTMKLSLILGLFLLISQASADQVYRCDTGSGKAIFSQFPCGDDASVIEVNPQPSGVSTEEAIKSRQENLEALEASSKRLKRRNLEVRIDNLVGKRNALSGKRDKKSPSCRRICGRPMISGRRR
jgi:hypothetical protein